MALDIVSQKTLQTVDPNINAPDVVRNYSNAFNNRTILVPKTMGIGKRSKLGDAGVGQIGAFVFDYHGDDEVDLETEITDHWLEDNTSVQDHIGVKPMIVTVKGFVAEKVLTKAQSLSINGAFSTITSNLSQVPAYLGTYTPGAVESLQKAISQAQNISIQIEQAAARAAQLASFFPSAPSANRQQAAYFELTSLALARVIFTVTTPFQVFDNMAIMSLRIIQPKETRGWSDFTVKMKQLNFTQDLSLPFFSANYAGRDAEQIQPGTQDGATRGLATPTTAVTGAFTA